MKKSKQGQINKLRIKAYSVGTHIIKATISLCHRNERFFEAYPGSIYPKALDESDNPRELGLLTLTGPSMDLEPIDRIIKQAMQKKSKNHYWMQTEEDQPI